MFGGPAVTNTMPKDLQGAQAQTGGFLASLLSQPAALKSFLGRTSGTLFDPIVGDIQSLVGGGGLAAGRQVVEAAEPVFTRNLQSALAQASAQAPGVFSTGLEMQGADISSRALQDFNLFAGQQLAQGQQRALQAAQLLGGFQQIQEAPLVDILNIAGRFFQPQAAQGPNAFQQAGGFFTDLIGSLPG